MTEAELGKALVEFVRGAAVIDRGTLTRAESMATLYGEACTKEKAAELLGCSRRSVTTYLQEGKIRACCEGKKIDVRSIAEYLESKPVIDRRRKGSRKEEWMV